jgi:hypothetical protein
VVLNTKSREPLRSESPLTVTVLPLMDVEVAKSVVFAVTWPEVATNAPELVLPAKVVGVVTSTAAEPAVVAMVNGPSNLRVALLGDAVSVETKVVVGE